MPAADPIEVLSSRQLALIEHLPEPQCTRTGRWPQ